MNSQISEFGMILLFLLTGIVFVLVGVGVAALMRPARPNDEKLTTYECGENTIGPSWINLNARYYVIALLFVLFEVEVIYLFPVAAVYNDAKLDTLSNGAWTSFALTELLIFMGLLFLGLIYAWRKGYLDWDMPESKPDAFVSKVPKQLYDDINAKYSVKK